MVFANSIQKRLAQNRTLDYSTSFVLAVMVGLGD